MDHHYTPYQESCPQSKYQFKESHGTPGTTTQKLERIDNTLLDQNDNRVQKMIPEVQKNCNSSSMRLESKTLETYMTCYDPQLLGVSCEHLVISLTLCAATSLDNRGTLVHKRPTNDKQTRRNNRSTSSKQGPHMQKTTKTVPEARKTKKWRRVPKTIQGVQMSPKPCKCRQ